MFKVASNIAVVGLFAQGVWAVPSTQPTSSPPATPMVYAKPAEVINACQTALRAGDKADYVHCFTPDAERQAVQMLIASIEMDPPPSTPATQPADRELAVLAKKYNLYPPRLPGEGDDKYAERVAASIKSPEAFLLDSPLQALSKTTPPSVLQNIHISRDGDTANGKLVRHDADGDMSQDVQLKKIKGSWKIDQIVAF